jgi:hypothetical protein
VIDVDSAERAHEVAAYVSSAPGKGGQPVYEWLEVRPFMEDAPRQRFLDELGVDESAFHVE